MSNAFQERFKDRVSAVGKQGEVEIGRSTPIKKDQKLLKTGPLGQTGVSVLQSTHIGHASLPFANFPQRHPIEALQFARPIKVTPNRGVVKSYESVSMPRMTPISNLLVDAGGFSLQPSEVQSLQDEAQANQVTFGPQTKCPLSRLPVQKSANLPPLPEKKNAKPHRLSTPYRRPVKKIQEKKSLSAEISGKNSIDPSPSNVFLKAGYSPYTLKDYRMIKTNKYMELGGLGPFMVGTEDWQRKKDLHDRRKHYGQQVLLTNSNKLAIDLSRPRLERREATPVNSRQRALEFARNIQLPGYKKQQNSVSESQEGTETPDFEGEHLRLKGYVDEIRAKLMG